MEHTFIVDITKDKNTMVSLLNDTIKLFINLLPNNRYEFKRVDNIFQLKKIEIHDINIYFQKYMVFYINDNTQHNSTPNMIPKLINKDNLFNDNQVIDEINKSRFYDIHNIPDCSLNYSNHIINDYYDGKIYKYSNPTPDNIIEFFENNIDCFEHKTLIRFEDNNEIFIFSKYDVNQIQKISENKLITLKKL